MNELAIFFALTGGFVAGCINTLAGNGSIITLGFLTEFMGLPGPLANGTNRLGVIGQGIFSLEPFIRNKKMPGSWAFRYIIWGIAGALVGAWFAIHSSAESFKIIYKYMVLGLLIYTIYRSSSRKSLFKQSDVTHLSPWFYIPVFLAFGFYGGFIQMGMGVFLLAFLLYYMKLDILTANSLKITMVTIYTGIAIPLFDYFGLIDWKIGLVLFAGEALGGWLTAQWASHIPNADKWAYRFLIFIMIVTLIKLFILDPLVFSK